MTTPTTTHTVTAAVTLLYGTPGSGTTPLLVVNLDSATTVYVSNQSTVTVGGPNSVPLAPGASLSSDGSTSLYAVTPGPKVQVALVPGGTQYFLPASLANIGGSKVYVQAGTPAGNIPVNSVWFDTSNGSLQTWTGTAWVNQAFSAQNLIQAATILGTQIASQSVTAGNIANGTLTTAQIAAAAGILGSQIASATITGANIAANTITASNIAANTITASQLAANIVYAGIVNGTTITGAQLIATGTNQNVLAYNGTPAAGNMLASVSPVAGTDSHANPYQQGLAVYGPNKSFVSLEGSTTTTEPIIKLSPQSVTNVQYAPQINATAANAGTTNTEYTTLWLQTGIETGSSNSPFIVLQGQSKDGSAVGSFTVAFQSAAAFADYFYVDTTQVVTRSPIKAADPASTGSGIGVEQWHNMTLLNGFSATTNVYNGFSDPPQYKMAPDGSVWLRGGLATPASGTITNTFASLPAAYGNTTAEAACAPLTSHAGTNNGNVALDAGGSLHLTGGLLATGLFIQLDCQIRRV